MPLPDPNFPYALDPSDFALFEEAAALKMQSEDLDSDGKKYMGEDALLRVVRDWGGMIQDPTAVAGYLAAVKEAIRVATIAELQATLAELEAQAP